MMHRPKYTPEVVPAERVSMMLEYLTKRVQDTPKLKSEELKQSVRRACDLIAARNNSPGCYQHGGTRPTYTDEIILDAFKVCITLGMREPLRDLVTAFRNETPDFVVRSLRDLISGIGFEEIKPM
jgi:ribosomal protein S7